MIKFNRERCARKRLLQELDDKTFNQLFKDDDSDYEIWFYINNFNGAGVVEI